MSILKAKAVATLLTLVMVISITFCPITNAIGTTITAKDAADFLYNKGILEGDGNGNLMLDDFFTREQAVVLISRLLNLEPEAKNYSINNLSFEDIEDNYYAPYIAFAQANGLVEGYNNKTFGFGDLLTAWEAKALMIRVLGFIDTKDEDIDYLANQIDISMNSNISSDISNNTAISRANMSLLVYNTLHAKTINKTILGEILGIIEPETSEYSFEAKVTRDDSVVVTFSKNVPDTSKVNFELIGLSSIELQVSWNEAKTIATLNTPSVLLEGTYTLTIEGLEFTNDQNTTKIIVEQNGISSIEIVGENLIKIDDSNANLYYKLYDKYGVDITEDTVSESDLNIASSKNLSIDKYDINNEKGKMTVKFQTNQLKDAKSVTITIIATDTGASINKTLIVSDFAQVSEITLSGIGFENEDTTKILIGEPNAAYILIDAIDQYGTSITSASDLEENGSRDVIYVISDNHVTISAEEYTDDNNVERVRLKVDTTALNVEKTVTVTAVSKLSGKSSSIILNIKEPSKSDKIKLSSPEQTVAEGDSKELLIIPITVYDKEGKQLTINEIVSAYNDGEIVVSGSGSFNNSSLKIATSGKYKGKVINNAVIGNEGTGVVSVITNTDVDTCTVNVKAVAYPKTIKLNKIPTWYLLVGSDTKMDYKFFDQYGRKIDTLGSTKVTIEVSDKDKLLVTSASGNTNVSNPYNSSVKSLGELTVTTCGEEGSSKIIAKLYNDLGTSVISKVETMISVTEGVPDTLIFEIMDIDTLVSVSEDTYSFASSINGNNPYARPITIVAKDSSDRTFAIPKERILSVTTADSDIIKVGYNSNNGTNVIDKQEKSYVVSALEKDSINWDNNETKTALIKAIISTDNGALEVVKEVKIIKEQPKVTNVIFAYCEDGGNPFSNGIENPYGLESDAVIITEISGLVSDIVNQKIYVYTLDQYGVYHNIPNPTFAVVNTDRFNGNNIPYDIITHTLSDFTADDITADKDIYIMYQADNGVYNTFKIRASNGTKIVP